MSESKADAPAIAVSLQVQLDAARSMTFHLGTEQTNLGKGFNGLMAQVCDAADRLSDRYHLQELKRALENNERKHRIAADSFDMIGDRHKLEWSQAGKKGEFRPTDRMAIEQRNAKVHLDEGAELIRKIRSDIAALEDRLADG